MQENKKLFSFRATDKTLGEIDSHFREDNCRNKNEFISKAIEFYCGYLDSNKNSNYLPDIITSTLGGMIEDSQMKISRVIYKFAVEQSLMMTMMACQDYDMTKSDIQQMRNECIKAINHTNGSFNMDDAYDWQRGDN